MTHICVGNLTIIGPDNGSSPGRRQAIICANAGILLIEPLGTNLSEILIGIQTFSFKKMHLKMSSAKWRPFCRGLNVLMAPCSPITSRIYRSGIHNGQGVRSGAHSRDLTYRQVSNIRRTKSQHLLSCGCLCRIPWSQLLSREWRCSWSSADRRRSNYIWVIENFIAYSSVSYIRGIWFFHELYNGELLAISSSDCQKNVIPTYKNTPASFENL